MREPPDPRSLAPTDAMAMMTALTHGGAPEDASAVPIEQANAVGGSYARHANATVRAFERKFHVLEGGAGSVATASGMAAVAQCLLALLCKGSRLVIHEKIFYGVRVLVSEYLPRFGIEVVAVDLNRLDLAAAALHVPGTTALYFETVSNPHIDVLNAPALLQLARAAGVLSIVDNTVLTPCLFAPLAHGADIVVHSASKYIGGHGDAIGGVVTAANTMLFERLLHARRIFGSIVSPLNAFLLQRGLVTLPMRINRHCDNADAVAGYLASHPKIKAVFHASLAGSAAQATASSFLRRYGGLISFELRDGRDRRALPKALRLCKSRYSFGEPGTTMLVQEWTPLIRLSVGLECPEDIIADLANGLDNVA